MTPEQTLDWLAQQHFDQCCEERPIQDWIRKMKSQLPEQPKQNTVEAVKAILKGIDQTEIESQDGWWETSAGAEFGAKKLKYVVGLLAQPEQEPVAMKFKIYKPTVPDPVRQGINNALLPWVYDQDRSSGFDASMWVTPVATLPPQRKPLTDEQIVKIADEYGAGGWICDFARAIEAAHGIKE